MCDAQLSDDIRSECYWLLGTAFLMDLQHS